MLIFVIQRNWCQIAPRPASPEVEVRPRPDCYYVANYIATENLDIVSSRQILAVCMLLRLSRTTNQYEYNAWLGYLTFVRT